MMTLAQAKTDQGFLTELGLDPTNAAFVPFINDAIRMAMEYGDWWLTVSKARVACYGRDLVFPRWVGTPLAMERCGEPLTLENKWWGMLPMSHADYGRHELRDRHVAVNAGETPVFQNVPPGMQIIPVAFATVGTDVGKTITVYGIGTDGNPIYTNQSGTVLPGVIVVIGNPIVTTTPKFLRVTRVSKPVTDGPVVLNQYEPTSAVTMAMGYYEPSETEPLYRYTSVPAVGFECRNCGTSRAQIYTILAKEAFIPVVNDADVLQIDNPEALQMMIQSIKKRRAGDLSAMMALRASAVKELGEQLKNRMPNDQITVGVHPFGTATTRRARIGTMI